VAYSSKAACDVSASDLTHSDRLREHIGRSVFEGVGSLIGHSIVSDTPWTERETTAVADTVADAVAAADGDANPASATDGNAQASRDGLSTGRREQRRRPGS
jgi:hypothetical protein